MTRDELIDSLFTDRARRIIEIANAILRPAPLLAVGYAIAMRTNFNDALGAVALLMFIAREMRSTRR